MATHSLGTTFKWNNVSVAGLTAINGFEMTADTVDTSTHLSSNGFKEILVGLKDGGQVTIEGFFDYTDTTGQHAMVTDFGAGTSRTAIITFPSATGTVWTGTTCYITAIKVGDAGIDNAIPFSATIKVTGKPTLTVTAVVGMSAIGFSNDVLMMPSFAIGRYGADNPYVVTITALETTTIITPVDATGGEIITITTDGGSSQVVATGEASTPCTLDVDDVTQIVVTISKTGCAPKAYYFNCAVLAA